MYIVLALFLVGTMINCGGSSSSGPAQVQAPKALIQDFISKHNIMVDTSLVGYYVTDEQPKIAADIKRTIGEKEATGELVKLQHATFDFSNITPININNGTAINVILDIMPKRRLGNADKNAESKVTVMMPIKANKSAVPLKAKATG